MAASQTRQRALLGALLVALAAVVWWNVLRPQPAAPVAVAPASAPRGAPGRPAARETMQAVEDVALGSLEAPRPEPAEGERNLFRFGQRQPPASHAAAGPEGPARPAPPQGAGQLGPVAAPIGPPTIPLRFVGLVERTRANRKIAILTDGRNTFYGAEGDIIEGRYRIVQIGTESVELVYLDGSGRQRLRLAGS